ADIALVGSTGTGTCMCPTTERDLADGIGPAVALQRAGSPLSLGSDSHAVIDLLEEARAMELDERLRSRTRGHWTAAALLRAATADGHAALGWDGAGRLEPGALADFTTIALDSVRTAGPQPRLAAETAVFAASAADVRHTVVGGRQVVRDGQHATVPDVPQALADSIAALRG
ncbi:amidohydrolase family protein, partial [Streptomyces sp.]